MIQTPAQTGLCLVLFHHPASLSGFMFDQLSAAGTSRRRGKTYFSASFLVLVILQRTAQTSPTQRGLPRPPLN